MFSRSTVSQSSHSPHRSHARLRNVALVSSPFSPHYFTLHHLRLSSIYLLAPYFVSLVYTHAVLENFSPSGNPTARNGCWTRFADRVHPTRAKEGGSQLRRGANERVVVAWSAETTKTNDDSTIGEARRAREKNERCVRASIVADGKRPDLLNLGDLSMKLLAIPIENASFRQQYCMCFAIANLFENRFISVAIAMVSKRERKERDGN